MTAQPRDLSELAGALEEIVKRRSGRLFYALYPDEQMPAPPVLAEHFPHKVIYPRRLYQRHLEFFRVGATYRERCAMAANRVGKTFGLGGYECAAHLTGQYPHWWEGRRFDRPVQAWAAGKTNETTRDIVQRTLLGSISGSNAGKRVDGTGIIPADTLGKLTWKQGVSDLVDTIRVKHVSGGMSTLGIKSYQQGRGSFEGTAKDLIWLDEEPPLDIYGECLIRTATTNGLVMLTFTPLEGMSETVMQFLPDDQRLDGMDESERYSLPSYLRAEAEAEGYAG